MKDHLRSNISLLIISLLATLRHWATRQDETMDLKPVSEFATLLAIPALVFLIFQQQNVIKRQQEMFDAFRPSKLVEDMRAVLALKEERIREEGSRKLNEAERQRLYAESQLARLRPDWLSDDAWSYLFIAALEAESPDGVLFLLGLVDRWAPVSAERFVKDYLCCKTTLRGGQVDIKSLIHEALRNPYLSQPSAQYAWQIIAELDQCPK